MSVPPFSTELFRLLVASVQDYAIYALDPEGRIVSWNAGAERIKGYTADEIVGAHFSRFYPPEEVAHGRPARLLERAQLDGRVEDEGWRVRKDGSRFWASVVITALRDGAGRLVGFAKITRDLSERRRAEQTLHERERQLAEAQRLAGLGSWRWDVEANAVTWTDELYRIYGLEAQEFAATYEAYLERVHPDDRERVRAIIGSAFQAGGAFDFEERIVRPDGAVRVLRSRGAAQRDEHGRVVRLVGTCQDITEQKEAEARARELIREQAARAAAEDAARRMEFLAGASEALAASLDYDATLRTVARLAVPAIADWCAVDLQEVDGVLRRVAVAHPDPACVELAERLHERYPPAPDAPHGAYHVLRTREPEFLPEIPEALLAAAAHDAEHLRILRELAPRSAITVPLVARDAVLGVITLVYADSGRRYRAEDLALAEDLARRAATAIENARLVWELAHARDQLAEQAIELEAQTEELQQLTEELEVSADELRRANDALAAEREEAEQARIAAEEANRAKSQFLATMSHELRTPLNAIAGYAELLLLEIHGPLSDAQREAVQRIQRNEQRLLSLVNDLLNFARLEAGQVRFDVADVPLARVLSELEALVEPQVRSRGLHYRCEECDAGVHVRADREKVEQILLNLLSNAIKFTPPGGQITVQGEADTHEVHVRVHDTGPGIPADKLETIFEPFVQIDSQRTREGEGVGLGLAISRDLARAMGGDLVAQSTPGEGSTFTLRLPRAERRETFPLPPLPAPAQA